MKKRLGFIGLSLAIAAVAMANPTAGFRGIYNTAPAPKWEDGFFGGNGMTGITSLGEPLDETIVFNNHKFIQPKNNTYIPPDMTPVLEPVRDQMLGGDLLGGWQTFVNHATANGWSTETSQDFHPGYYLRIGHSADGTISNYNHICNYETGEVIVQWDDNRGSWTRKTFVSRSNDTVVTLLEKPTGALLDCTLRMEPAAGHPGNYPIVEGNSTNFLNYRCTYPVMDSGQGGYEGVTRVIANGASANSYFAEDSTGAIFSASNPIVETPDNALLDLTTAVTLEAWVKAGTQGANGARLIDKSVASTSDGYMLDTYPGNSLRMITAGGNLSYAANLSNEWTHVVGVFDYSQGIHKLYIDGSEVASRTPSASLVTTDIPLRLGADSSGGNRLEGLMKRVTVYNRALTGPEVASLAAVSDMSSLDLSGRVADWDLDDDVGGQVTSSAPGGLVLTGISVGSTDELIIEDADSVLLLTKLDRYKDDFSEWDNLNLQTELNLITKNYDQLLADHVALHGELFNRVTYDLDASEVDRALPIATLIDNQLANSNTVNKAMVEQLFDASRYLFLCSSGPEYGPRLTGIFLGTWGAAWQGDYVTNVNWPLQIAGGNIGNMSEAMEGSFQLLERTKDDWAAGASNLFGCRGIVGPVRIDGERALFRNFTEWYAHSASTGYGPWMVFFMYEYYQITGDLTFLQDRVYPFLHDMSIFYEDFLTRTNGSGEVIFVPSASPENSSSTMGGATMAAVNSTFDIMACKHGLQMAIETANTLGLEQGAGEGVERWTALMAKLPAYQTEPDGTLKEWAWDIAESYGHRHTSHAYAVWPGYEINPEDPSTSSLVPAMKKALDIRVGGSGTLQNPAHGNMQQSWAYVRIKEGEKFGEILKNMLTRNYIYDGMMTTHVPDLGTLLTDYIVTVQGPLMEAAVLTQPGMIELLPAMPSYLDTGTLTGIKGRNRTTIQNLEWDMNVGSVTCTFISDITQDLQLIFRDGIDSISCNAPISGTGIYRTISATADVPVTLLIGTPVPGPGSNLILNPSFEEGSATPSDWNINSSEGVITNAQDGAASLRVDAPWEGANQTISVETGVTYNISVWIDASTMTSGNVVFDTSDEYDDTCQFALYNANGGWEEFTGSFTATDTSVTLRIFAEGAFAGTAFFDNVSLTGPGGGSGYDQWAALNGVTGSITDDDDGDGRDNLYEYALDGHPTFAGDEGVSPFFTKAGSTFNYVHLQRNDDTNLVYTVETRTNLVTGSWVPLGSPAGTNVMGGGLYYDEVTNTIPTTAAQTYIRLKVQNQ